MYKLRTKSIVRWCLHLKKLNGKFAKKLTVSQVMDWSTHGLVNPPKALLLIMERQHYICILYITVKIHRNKRLIFTIFRESFHDRYAIHFP